MVLSHHHAEWIGFLYGLMVCVTRACFGVTGVSHRLRTCVKTFRLPQAGHRGVKRLASAPADASIRLA